MRTAALIAVLVPGALLEQFVKALLLRRRQYVAEFQFGSFELLAKVGRDWFHQPLGSLLALAKHFFDPFPLLSGQVELPLRSPQELETVPTLSRRLKGGGSREPSRAHAGELVRPPNKQSPGDNPGAENQDSG